MSRLERIAPVALLAACLALVYPAQRWVDRLAGDESAEQEVLYLSDPESVRRLALGYDALLADLYWMRAIQYFGNKSIASREAGSKTPDMKLLYPLLDVATTLDPRNIQAHRFGGFFLFYSKERQGAFSLLEKGLRNNPTNLRLYQDLAFFHWNDGDCEEASRLYRQGATLPRAPVWMKKMGALVLADCGRRDLAVEQLEAMLATTEDPRIRKEIEERLLGYRALDEIEFLGRATAFFRERTGRLPASLAELVRTTRPVSQPGAPRFELDSDGTPLDPTGVPYVYDPKTGKVTTRRLYLPEPIVRKPPRTAA